MGGGGIWRDSLHILVKVINIQPRLFRGLDRIISSTISISAVGKVFFFNLLCLLIRSWIISSIISISAVGKVFFFNLLCLLIRSWIFKINKKIVSLTELMAGVKAPSKTCQLFQLMCWPQGYKVGQPADHPPHSM